jgi:HEAT repeat protein
MNVRWIAGIIVALLAGAGLYLFWAGGGNATSRDTSEQKPAGGTGGDQAPKKPENSTKPDASEGETKGAGGSTAGQAWVAPPVTVTDPELARLLDPNARDRVTPDLDARIPTISPEDLPAALIVFRNPKEDDTVRHELANLLRRSNYPRLTEDLIEILNNQEESERFRDFAVQHLFLNAEEQPEQRDKVLPVLHGALEDRHDKVRAEALLALCRLRAERGQATALAWLRDASPAQDGVRYQAIRCVHLLGLRETMPELRRLAAEGSESERIKAIVALADWKDDSIRPLLEEIAQAQDASQALKSCATGALKRLAP